MDAYFTLATPGEALFTEKRSKFYAFAFHVQTAEEAKNKVEELRKRFYDARHVCYAYALGYDGETSRMNDDGEPSSSAGRPILGAIRSAQLTFCLVVVVRYFGGVKLGTGGLVVAYKTAAAQAIAAASTTERLVMERSEFFVPYTEANTAMRFLKDAQADIVQHDYEAQGHRLTYEIRLSAAAALRDRLTKILSLRFVQDE